MHPYMAVLASNAVRASATAALFASGTVVPLFPVVDHVEGDDLPTGA